MVTNKRGYLQEYFHREQHKIYEQLGGVCEVCGIKENLQIHHKIPTISGRGRGSLNRLSDWKKELPTGNLMLVCEQCHLKIHSIDEENFYPSARTVPIRKGGEAYGKRMSTMPRN